MKWRVSYSHTSQVEYFQDSETAIEGVELVIGKAEMYDDGMGELTWTRPGREDLVIARCKAQPDHSSWES